MTVIGHYVNDMYNPKRDVWLSYDDSHVSVTSVQEVCRRRKESGYMFFYMDRLVAHASSGY